MRSRSIRNRKNVMMGSSDRLASSSGGRRAPTWGYTTQLNSSRLPRTNPDIMPARVRESVSIRKRHQARPKPTDAAPALNPGMCVCACFTSAPRLFADSKLCRTMPAKPLSLADYKMGKNGKSSGCSFVDPVMEIVDTLTGPYPAETRLHFCQEDRSVKYKEVAFLIISFQEKSQVFLSLLFNKKFARISNPL